MTFVCDGCARSARGLPFVSATGRDLCPECRDRFLGAAAAMSSGGCTGESVATVGWLGRVRRARRGDR